MRKSALREPRRSPRRWPQSSQKHLTQSAQRAGRLIGPRMRAGVTWIHEWNDKPKSDRDGLVVPFADPREAALRPTDRPLTFVTFVRESFSCPLWLRRLCGLCGQRMIEPREIEDDRRQARVVVVAAAAGDERADELLNHRAHGRRDVV